MGQGSRLHLKDVIGQLLRRDASLSRVDASDGIPMQGEAYRSGDDLAVTITQGQRRSASGDLTIKHLSSTVADLGMKTVLRAAKCVETKPLSSARLYALNNKCDPNPPAHL